MREVRILKTLNHPHITRLYEVIDTPQEVFLAMEYAEGGELFDYLVGHGRMKEKDARKQFRQIISAVDFCHTRHVIHRDLKAENLLLDLQMNAKIADFGFSNNFEDGKPLSTWCGSPPYAAPELFQGREYLGPEVDIWSLGVVLYVLICGTLPFDGSTLVAVRQRVLSGDFKVPFYMTHDCERLIRGMLALDPAQRITIEEIREDKWFNDGYEPLSDPKEAEIVITMSQHAFILSRMEDLGIPRNITERALNSQSFDNIWATYYLIADQVAPRTPIETGPTRPADLQARGQNTASAGKSVVLVVPSSTEEARAVSPPTADQPHARKSRRHTVTAQVDVAQARKDMSSKRAIPSKIDTTTPTAAGTGGSTHSSPGDSYPNTPIPGSPIYCIPEESDGSQITLRQRSPTTSAAPIVSTPSTPSSEAPPTPIPRKKKDRRERAISLNRNRPSSMYSTMTTSTSAAFSSTAQTPTATPRGSEDAGSPSAQSSFAVSSPPLSTRSISPSNSRGSLPLQSSGRRISIKEKLKKSFGLPSKDPEQRVEPKTVYFQFSVSTTSAKTPQELTDEVVRIMETFEVAHERENFLFLANKDNVAFEVEICKLPRLAMHGIRFKRLAGDSWAYKTLCSSMVAKMRL